MASYSYDPYGRIASETSTLNQPYRISTKRYYSDLGVSDYGFRFCSPVLGRWMSRDPLGEAGGLNLYAAMGNNSINSADAIGLANTSIYVPFPDIVVSALLLDPWFRHYFLNNGVVANVSDMGLEGAFLNAPDVRASTNKFKNKCSQAARKYAGMYCSCGSGKASFDFQVPAKRYRPNFTNVAGLVPIGNSNLTISASCKLEVDCSRKIFKYSCQLHYLTTDAFEDPLDIRDWVKEPDFEVFRGAPYKIIFDYRSDISGSGRW